ncbi:16S rRNA (guanine(527)-N(7))-methyltransferase RsmG [Magnetococcus marinus]|nr:16S rRNA (guanine(527)-N(7))-methyltransferase RsmG [Magnetococcus marinus]
MLQLVGVDMDVISVDPYSDEKLAEFVSELLLWNKKINLIGKSTEKSIWSRHIAESLILLPYVQGSTVLDMGTGAGLPGLPLQIVSGSNIEMHLVEKDQKKVSFLKHVSANLNLKNIRIYNKQFTEKGFDGAPLVNVVTSRALAEINQLVAWADPCLVNGGSLVLIKGPVCKAELEKFEESDLSDKYENGEIVEYKIDSHDVNIVIIKKK